MTSLKADEAPVAFQVGTSRFQTWDCSQELRPGHINQLSAGLQGSGKAAVARNAPDCTTLREKSPQKHTQMWPVLGWSSCPFPGQAHTAAQGGCWRPGSATEGHRDRLSRPVTDRQAQGERDSTCLCQLQRRAGGACEDKVTQSNRTETRALLGQQIPKEVREEQQSKGENGQSEFRVSGAQLPESQTSQMVKGGRITWRFCQAQGFCSSSSRLRR